MATAKRKLGYGAPGKAKSHTGPSPFHRMNETLLWAPGWFGALGPGRADGEAAPRGRSWAPPAGC